jgi:hypothetical protein
VPVARASSACRSLETTCSGRCRLLFERFIEDSSRPRGPRKSPLAGGPVQRTPVTANRGSRSPDLDAYR